MICVLDYERKALCLRNKAAPFNRKLSHSYSYSLNFGYLPVMHSVAFLSEIESMLSKNNELDAWYINRLREFVIAYGDIFSWEGHAIGPSNVT